jgi:hypothetical protein
MKTQKEMIAAGYKKVNVDLYCGITTIRGRKEFTDHNPAVKVIAAHQDYDGGYYDVATLLLPPGMTVGQVWGTSRCDVGDHEYAEKTCRKCGQVFCYGCCGSQNVDQGGKYDEDHMTCPKCGQDWHGRCPENEEECEVCGGLCRPHEYPKGYCRYEK